MSISYSNKHKILLILKLLYKKSNYDHPITVYEIINYLQEYNISAERKAVYNDIKVLSDLGIDIIVTKVSHSNAYYIGSRTFAKEDLSLISDLLASSKYISDKKYSSLIKKFQEFTSIYDNKSLISHVSTFKTDKIYANVLINNIFIINSAINNDNIIAFKPFIYDINKNKKYYNSNRYIYVVPEYISYEYGNYYIFCYNYKNKKNCRYQIDRIAYLKEYKKENIEKDLTNNINLQNVKSFEDKNINIIIQFDRCVFDSVVDKFDKNTSFIKNSKKTFIMVAKIELNEQFLGWILSFGDKAKVIGNEKAITSVKNYINILYNQYK